jgi:hypothetical protein
MQNLNLFANIMQMKNERKSESPSFPLQPDSKIGLLVPEPVTEREEESSDFSMARKIDIQIDGVTERKVSSFESESI